MAHPILSASHWLWVPTFAAAMRLFMRPIVAWSIFAWPVAAVAQAPDAPENRITPTVAPATEAQCAIWVAWLADPRFDRRQTAQRRLQDAGTVGLAPLATATGSDDLEQSHRAATLLVGLAWSSDEATATAARAVLDRLERSAQPNSVRAITRAVRSQRNQVANQLRQHGLAVTWSENQPVRAIVNGSSPHVRDDTLRLLRHLPIAELDLRNSAVTDAGLEHLADQQHLTRLNLQRTKVTNRGLERVCPGLTRLESLSVEHTRVDDRGLAFLAACPQLTTLYLGGSAVKGPGLEHLAEHPLTYLSFQHSELDDSVTQSVAKLKRLETLGLDDTSVTDASLEPLTELKQLKVLWLDRSQITDASVPVLLRLDGLKTLHLEDTELSDEAIERLREQAPKVQVVR